MSNTIAYDSIPHSHYLDAEQQAWIHQQQQSWLWRLELPTWALIAFIYGGWLTTVLHWHSLGPLMGTPLLVVLTSWYLSLQHELIHGHPTRFVWFNQLLGQAPLAVWYPYGLYRDSHLAHHQDFNLTLPGLDPESYYLSAECWAKLSAPHRALYRLRDTMPGRLLLGPAFGLVTTFRITLHDLAAGKRRIWGRWAVHATLLACLFSFLGHHGIAPVFYLAAVAYPALSLASIRSYYEHRAVEPSHGRTVLNEAAWPWRLLFLNLNYHLVHHDLPSVPWYGLRKVYLAHRTAYIERSGGYLVAGYGTWFRQHWRRPVLETVHPFATESMDKPERLALSQSNT